MQKFKFDRMEFAGALGDLGTLIPIFNIFGCYKWAESYGYLTPCRIALHQMLR